MFCMFYPCTNRLSTVRENLVFACKMYEPSLPQEERDHRVDEVLASLGLESCQHTKVRPSVMTIDISLTWYIRAGYLSNVLD